MRGGFCAGGYPASLGHVTATQLTRVPGMPGTYLESATAYSNPNDPKTFHPAVLVYGPLP